MRDAVVRQTLRGELYTPELCEEHRVLRDDPRWVSEERIAG
jgi:hypothetical protein